MVPPLKDTDNGVKALSWMGEFHLPDFPVVSGKKFVGMVSEFDILDMENPQLLLSSLDFDDTVERVREFELVYDIVKKMHHAKLGAIAVVDDKDNYIGVINSESILHYFATTNAFQDPGGVIVLEMKSRDYSLVEIAQIIESNNATILASFISVSSSDTEKLTVTLKISKLEVEGIIATFERYNYTVRAVYQETEDPELLQERLDALMSYLNI